MTVTFKDNSGNVTKSVEYVYDMFNQRIGKQVFDAGITLVKNERYVWNDGNVALDFDDTDLDGQAEEDELSRRYLWGQRVDEFFGQENIEEILGDSVVNWALFDNQGTVRDLATYDEQSELAAIDHHFTYGAFGDLTTPGIPATRFLYTAQEWDADAGLHYYNNRWYDPAVGQFLSADPVEDDLTNTYRYVGNSPVNGTDPTGLFKSHELQALYSLAFADNCKMLKLQEAYEKAGGKVEVVSSWNPSVWGTNSDHDNFWWHSDQNPMTIQIRGGISLESALAELAEGYIAASGTVHVKKYITSANFDDIDLLCQSYRQSLKQSAGAVSAATELYLSGIGIANEGADWVLTINEVNEGNYAAAVAFLPLVGAALFKGGKSLIIRAGGETFGTFDAELASQLNTFIGSMTPEAASQFIKKSSELVENGKVKLPAANNPDDVIRFIRRVQSEIQTAELGVQFTKEMLSHSQVIAKRSAIRKIDTLVNVFGGQRKGWVKKKGWDSSGKEFHWYEHHGIGRVAVKPAGQADQF